MIVLWRTRWSKRRKMAAQVPYEGHWALGPKRGFPVPSVGLIWAERDQEGRSCDLQTRGRYENWPPPEHTPITLQMLQSPDKTPLCAFLGQSLGY